jgi:hypothetical protein
MSFILLIIGSIIMGNSVSAGVGWGCFFLGLAILCAIDPPKIEFRGDDDGS